jgi:hypothetical protein
LLQLHAVYQTILSGLDGGRHNNKIIMTFKDAPLFPFRIRFSCLLEHKYVVQDHPIEQRKEGKLINSAREIN